MARKRRVSRRRKRLYAVAFILFAAVIIASLAYAEQEFAKDVEATGLLRIYPVSIYITKVEFEPNSTKPASVSMSMWLAIENPSPRQLTILPSGIDIFLEQTRVGRMTLAPINVVERNITKVPRSFSVNLSELRSDDQIIFHDWLEPRLKGVSSTELTLAGSVEVPMRLLYLQVRTHRFPLDVTQRVPVFLAAS